MPRPDQLKLDPIDGADLSALSGAEPDGLIGLIESVIRLANSGHVRQTLMRLSGFPAEDIPAFLALNQLVLHGALRPTDLAEQLDTGRSNATKIVERLQAMDLVLRLPDPEDARGVLVALSPHGRAIGRRLVDTNQSMLDRLSADWHPDDIPTFQRLLRQLISGYETINDPPLG
ncbi:MarR family winged helix-turn-helix transcriptional regulator [Microbacterium oleivorans]|uniref:MarR family transcriptional regulator n=1 Tax=Microbacterium oleivorans TaxID=273677 RepID=A0A7D5J0I4_9MICO|nr:MarR family transcriptional regulator [Microbacterium oleivorans]QLD12755.1 MarR family transcriptional regulator [Microbacterium oleivorans]